MTTKRISNFFKVCGLLFIGMTFAACSSDPKIEKDPDPAPSPTPDPQVEEYPLEGEWFEGESNDNEISFGVYDYKSDGTFTCHYADVRKDHTNNVFDYSGTYTHSKDNLVMTYTHPVLGANKDEYTVKSITKYNYTIYHKKSQITEEVNKIVDTYQMKVGETKSVRISDNDFTPQQYQSNAIRIADVDGNGTITAKMIGTAYISVKSPIGTAVIRVEITDPDNLFIDFSVHLGSNIKYIPDIYGHEYIDTQNEQQKSKGLKGRHYEIYDKYIRNVDFLFDEEGTILFVLPSFRTDIDKEAISKQLAKKFRYLEYDEKKEVEVYGIIWTDIAKPLADKIEYANWSPSNYTITYEIHDYWAVNDFTRFLHKKFTTIENSLGDNYKSSAKANGKLVRHYDINDAVISYIEFYCYEDEIVDELRIQINDNIEASYISSMLEGSEFFYRMDDEKGKEVYVGRAALGGNEVHVIVYWYPSEHYITYEIRI